LSAAVLSLALAAPLALSQQPVNDPPVPDSPAIEQRVDAMLSKLTLQQKLELIGGEDSMFIRAEPAAGSPRLKMSDGPFGVRTWGPDTAYAAGIALAASWDPDLVRQMGISIADDARARGVNFLLAPAVNIYRAPMAGRSFEYFGEDPYLSGHTAIPYIEGVQSQGVVATVKHFALNNQEYDRHNVSSDVDERTLREIYMPAFEDAVKIAHVGAVMNSYNLVDGVHASENKHLNIDILRKDWGFKGILMSDWTSVYSAIGPANNGLDLEMPSGVFMNPKNLLPAIKSGKVSEATIDQKVRRIFRTAIRFHFLDRDQTILSIPAYTQMGREASLREALESITLLKNDGNILPLDESKVHTIAVFGPDAWPAVPGGGGSSEVTPFQASSIMTGLSDYLGKRAKVLYARGLPTAKEVFTGTSFVGRNSKPGTPHNDAVKVETFDNANFSGIPQVEYISRIANFRPDEGAPSKKQHKSIRLTAEFLPETTGSYMVLATAVGRDSYTVLINGKKILAQPNTGDRQYPLSADLTFTANQPVSVQVDYVPEAANAHMSLGIRPMSDIISPDVAKLASMADAAVVSVGFDPSTEAEGSDRSYQLPWGQEELIAAVSAANKKTIVTLTAGGGVATANWINKVPVFLHNYYPGEEGGKAFAEILFGQHSPEGHLPFSFAKSWEQNPTHNNYYPAPHAPGQTPHVKYAEGVYVGYRYYTTKHVEPLFPFGFGLSYTTFRFSNLKVSPETASADGPITVSFDVTNTGQRKGAEVAQLYVGDPSAKIDRPVKELKGYKKVRLDPDKTEHVTLTLNRRSLAYWDTASNNWRVDPGKFVVYVGDSSEHTPLEASFEVR
jgi:beta-glucosidase